MRNPALLQLGHAQVCARFSWAFSGLAQALLASVYPAVPDYS